MYPGAHLIKSVCILQNSHTSRLALEEDNEVNRRSGGSTDKALVGTEMVRKLLPGANSGVPKQFHLHRKEKKKNILTISNVLIFVLKHCY